MRNMNYLLPAKYQITTTIIKITQEEKQPLIFCPFFSMADSVKIDAGV
jgi:hypothetical protein